jgi:hypothetical protein
MDYQPLAGVDMDDKLRGAEREWERLFLSCTAEGLVEPNPLPPIVERIELGRDEFYEIVGTVHGEFRDYQSKVANLFSEKTDFNAAGEQGSSEVVVEQGFIGYTPGQRIPVFDIYASDRLRQTTIVMKKCRENGLTTGDRTADYVGWVSAEAVEIVRSTHDDAVSLIEWFLNGPRSYVYPQYTARTVEGIFQKRRLFPHSKDAILREPVQQSITADFAFVPLESGAFAIQAVPKEFGPPWSRNIGIEYNRDWGSIPDPHDRVMIKEIVSFVIGRPLLAVGYTMYDQSQRPIEEVSTGPGLPKAYSIISLCQAGDSSPINFESHLLEDALATLVPSYLRLRDGLRLNEALYRYWFAKIHPIGLDLPVFAAAVESLASSWHRSSDSTLAKQYLTEDEFKRLFAEEIKSFGQKLKDIPSGHRILNRIKSAHRMGSNEQVESFLADAKLKIGGVEETAMRSRNPMAHGSSSDYHGEELDQMVRIRWAYQALFERVFLKILGYSGNYIDRTSYGWPERYINEPPAGADT